MMESDPDNDDREFGPPSEPTEAPHPAVSFRTAMLVYAGLVVFCIATLHGSALFIALLIVFAIALKTWIARVRDRLE